MTAADIVCAIRAAGATVELDTGGIRCRRASAVRPELRAGLAEAWEEVAFLLEAEREHPTGDLGLSAVLAIFGGAVLESRRAADDSSTAPTAGLIAGSTEAPQQSPVTETSSRRWPARRDRRRRLPLADCQSLFGATS